MPAYLLINYYTLLGIVNNVRYIVHGVIPYPNSKNNSFGSIIAIKKHPI